MNYTITHLKPFGVLLEPISISKSIKDLDIEILRKLFWQEQLVVFRGFDTFTNSDDFSNYCDRWGEVSLWPFGKVLELIQHDSPTDHIFDHSYVPMHWDGMYREQIPEYQIFHCKTAPLAGQGGRTIFANTILVLKNSPSKIIKLWGKVTGVYQRKMEFYNSKIVSKIITKHPRNNFSVIRYNEPHIAGSAHFVNPPEIKFTGVCSEYLDSFHKSLKQALYDGENNYAHEWRTGDVVIADNFSLLHGREEFVSKSPRHIRRVQVLSNPPYYNPGLESYQ